MKELINIQSFLKAPKDKRNTFGGYNYRSCESILEAVKPLLKAEACTLTINDDIVQVGERYYIKATATLRNSSGESVSATALAREEETKKGMDGAQVTGAASSYARKYALNGLFAIDDTKDPDTDEHYKRTHQPEQKPKATAKKAITFDTLNDDTTRISLYGWIFKKFNEAGCPMDFDAVDTLRTAYDIDNETAEVFRNGYANYHVEKLTPKQR